MSPLVTILIATKDRPDDLRLTLRQISQQTYPKIELLIIDDGSVPSIEDIVRQESRDAVYIYEKPSAGQSKRRSEGFAMAKGEYILQLDDDSFPVDPEAVSSAVGIMEERREIGVLSFWIFNGERLPKVLLVPQAKYHSSFVGCGALFRSAAVRCTSGYRHFFGNEWEEEELSLQIMKAGWAIYFFPRVLVHHHVSAQNRLTTRTWKRGFRNKMWALLIHFPLYRLPVEMSWVLGIATFDAFRLLRFGSFVRGFIEFLGGLPRALQLRDPMSKEVLRRYDAMRFGLVVSEEEYTNPRRIGIGDFRQWFLAWWVRPRQRSFWDSRPGDTGQSPTVKYAHEFKGGSNPGDS
jgi:GT2 family glycosyltransferase